MCLTVDKVIYYSLLARIFMSYAEMPKIYDIITTVQDKISYIMNNIVRLFTKCIIVICPLKLTGKMM